MIGMRRGSWLLRQCVNMLLFTYASSRCNVLAVIVVRANAYVLFQTGPRALVGQMNIFE